MRSCDDKCLFSVLVDIRFLRFVVRSQRVCFGLCVRIHPDTTFMPITNRPQSWFVSTLPKETHYETENRSFCFSISNRSEPICS